MHPENRKCLTKGYWAVVIPGRRRERLGILHGDLHLLYFRILSWFAVRTEKVGLVHVEWVVQHQLYYSVHWYCLHSLLIVQHAGICMYRLNIFHVKEADMVTFDLLGDANRLIKSLFLLPCYPLILNPKRLQVLCLFKRKIHVLWEMIWSIYILLICTKQELYIHIYLTKAWTVTSP